MRKVGLNKANAKSKAVIIILSVIILVQWILLIDKSKKEPETKITPIKTKARIAIVIDDWGYNLRNLNILKQLRYPLTLSILPNLNYSQILAREFNNLGFEVMLHLPMEPRENFNLEKDTIMSSSSDSEIAKIIDKDLTSVVFAKGVSNHMGSKLTEDTAKIAVIFRELKKRELYFLDSLVSSKSICSVLASKLKVNFASRDVFLDNQPDYEYIRGQLNKLKSKASLKGYAIGIGHNRKATLEVLMQELPKLGEEGYKLVFVSELVR